MAGGMLMCVHARLEALPDHSSAHAEPRLHCYPEAWYFPLTSQFGLAGLPFLGAVPLP